MFPHMKPPLHFVVQEDTTDGTFEFRVSFRVRDLAHMALLLLVGLTLSALFALRGGVNFHVSLQIKFFKECL